ncbi:PAS domain-containing protein [Pantoea vagans]|uniref:helix-turn-helix transcriptional regulator n=1 Tax=Pantoea vagans TaxID=470934 RepID=UPI0022501242|nr:PAS domain-containing protein [Pantoea vagans]MCX3310979.1 PAS domain-containing protein [Pantoea vagans]
MLDIFATNFSVKDHEHMTSYFRLADMVADLVGPHCEVVIHSFESLENSVVKIVNGHHTGRIIGSPITDMGLKMLRLFTQTGEVNSKSYFTRSPAGHYLKSTTCVIAGENNKPIGLFCVNINLSTPFNEILSTLTPEIKLNRVLHENFSNNTQDVIEQAVQDIMNEISGDATINKKMRNKAVIYQLYENGIFELKESTTVVAEKLGITRHAVYKYLRDFKSTLREKE